MKAAKFRIITIFIDHKYRIPSMRLTFFILIILSAVKPAAQVPVINSFAPVSGPVGTNITIQGSGFSNINNNNIVFFGAVQAAVSSATTTSLQVNVPAGATYQPLTVTVNGLTGYASLPFVVTFPGSNGSFTESSFGDRLYYQTGHWPSFMKVTDIDGDNKPDLVMVNGTSNNFVVYRNINTGNNIQFATPAIFPTAYTPGRIITADLDGDNKKDLVLTNAVSPFQTVISFFRNTSTPGNINFAPRVDSTYGNGGVSITATDIDGDGKTDLIATCGNCGKFSVFRNISTAGSIGFEAGVSFTLLMHGDFVATGDFDGDGKQDIALADFSQDSISIFRNISIPGSVMLAPKINYAAGDMPSGIVVGDLNGDNKPDIASINYVSATVSLFKNISSTGIAFEPAVNIVADTTATTLEIGDLDGDSKPDIIVSYIDTGFISVYRNTSAANGAFSFEPKKEYSTVYRQNYGVIADLNNDSKPEIIVSNPHRDTLFILPNKIGDTLQQALCPPIGSTSITTAQVAGSYQWQADTGSGFTNIINNANYSGVNTATLQLINIPSSWYGYKYRCVADANNGVPYKITFSNNWTGAIDNHWENPANWSCGSVPDMNTDVIISAGTVLVNSNVIIRTLNINASVVLTVSSGNTLTITQ